MKARAGHRKIFLHQNSQSNWETSEMLEKTQVILLVTSTGCFKIQMVLLWFHLSVADLHKRRVENDFSKRDQSDGSRGWQLPNLWVCGFAQHAGLCLLFGRWINILLGFAANRRLDSIFSEFFLHAEILGPGLGLILVLGIYLLLWPISRFDTWLYRAVILVARLSYGSGLGIEEDMEERCSHPCLPAGTRL